MTGHIDDFISLCGRQPDGFAAIAPSNTWRLGGVVFAENGDRFAAVRKAIKEGYEFSGFWALPGGMVRVWNPDISASSAAYIALTERFEAETGFSPGDLQSVKTLGPVTTAYTVGNRRRHTVIFACTSVLGLAQRAFPNDKSVSEFAWLSLFPSFATVAPGNRLILGHILWPRMTKAQKDDARPLIAAALTQCADAAAEAGVKRPVAPWDPADMQAAWIAAWPTH